MFERLRRLPRIRAIAAGLMIVLAVPALGQVAGDATAARTDPTVRAVLPGCRSLLATRGIPGSAEAAFCSGMIDALLYLGELLPEDLCYAVPLDMPRVAVLRAIVDEIEDAYPSVKEQHFRALALDVLQYKWPCRFG